MTMKTAYRNVFALTAILALSVPAFADWEGTQWGMSPDEVLAKLDAASSHSPAASEIFEYDGAQYRPLVKLGHAIDGVEGEASLLFDANDTLRFVAFSPTDLAECDALATALSARHGEVKPTGFGATAIYNWEDGENVIRLTNSADIGICNLSFGAV